MCLLTVWPWPCDLELWQYILATYILLSVVTIFLPRLKFYPFISYSAFSSELVRPWAHCRDSTRLNCRWTLLSLSWPAELSWIGPDDVITVETQLDNKSPVCCQLWNSEHVQLHDWQKSRDFFSDQLSWVFRVISSPDSTQLNSTQLNWPVQWQVDIRTVICRVLLNAPPFRLGTNNNVITVIL